MVTGQAKGQGSEAQTAAERTYRAIVEKANADLDGTRLVSDLRQFIRDNPTFPGLLDAYSRLLTHAAADRDHPDRTLAVAEEALAKYPNPPLELRRLAVEARLSAWQALKREDDVAAACRALLREESDPLLLLAGARYDRARAVDFLDKAIAERAKNPDADAVPRLDVLQWNRVTTLYEAGRSEEAASAGIAVLRAIETALGTLDERDDAKKRRARRLRTSLSSRSREMATRLAEAGRFDEALDCLSISERSGEPLFSHDLARQRGRVYAKMGRLNDALDQYTRAYALEMLPATKEQIVQLAAKTGSNPEAAFGRAREIRMLAASPMDGFELKRSGGGMATFDALRSKNGVTLVTFFFPSCRGCILEFPHIQALQQKYNDAGFQVVAINTTPEEDGDVEPMRKKLGLRFPILLTPEPGFAEARWNVRVLPTNLLLDSSGRIVFRHLGYDPGVSEQTLETEIRELLGSDRPHDMRDLERIAFLKTCSSSRNRPRSVSRDSFTRPAWTTRPQARP